MDGRTCRNTEAAEADTSVCEPVVTADAHLAVATEAAADAAVFFVGDLPDAWI